MSSDLAVRPVGPARVVELDLDRPGELRSPGGLQETSPTGRALALVRLRGHPLGLVEATAAPGDSAGLRRALVEAAHRELGTPAPITARRAAPHDQPTVSVVICTHNRQRMLRQCLDSLLRTGYPYVEVIVVDNAPSSDATEELIRTRYPDQVRYVREPVAGSSRARNRGLAAARGEICAFADDDVIIDADWVSSLVDAFQADGRVGCVTGLVLPAELDTEAQVAVEQYGGYAKGFTARSWSLRERPDDPLLPFKVCMFGSGANMAFRTELFRRLDGFDPAIGIGTPARGGEDLLAFFRVLVDGYTVAYQPDAIVWHRHRRTMDALTTSIFNFGVGFGAVLAAAVVHEPGLLAVLLRGLPRGARQWWAGRARDQAALNGANSPRHLGRKELHGLLYGPFTYLFSLWQQRSASDRGTVTSSGGRP
ncbi:glycosyltransferase [Kitasatospora sp. MAP5-34]|uniref:glycosyltransferase n=1 Tax=Kitasatospora sp. MAP5-34 TaxID=3035102 RepID=UPI002475971B|nr:glycosyltransferase [Kitasatospora sp. MAP5-34]MDH6575134.1 GT2 family glycosyltransferase [Kitasatospora sp. MAP5-34]